MKPADLSEMAPEVERLLQEHDGNVRAVARACGVPRTTMAMRITRMVALGLVTAPDDVVAIKRRRQSHALEREIYEVRGNIARLARRHGVTAGTMADRISALTSAGWLPEGHAAMCRRIAAMEREQRAKDRQVMAPLWSALNRRMGREEADGYLEALTGAEVIA